MGDSGVMTGRTDAAAVGTGGAGASTGPVSLRLWRTVRPAGMPAAPRATPLPDAVVTDAPPAPGAVVSRPEEASLGALGRQLAREPAAFEELYARLGPDVLRLLRRLLPAQDAEDVLQNTFADVWRDRAVFDPERPIGAWVSGIARHRAVDLLRSRVPRPVGAPEEVDAHGSRTHVLPAGDEVADRVVRTRLLAVALRTVAVEQREVLSLAYFHDMTQPEIAEWLAVPVGTVKARAARGLRAVARTLRTPPSQDPS